MGPLLAPAVAGAMLTSGCSTTIDSETSAHPAALMTGAPLADDAPLTDPASPLTDGSWTAVRVPWMFADYSGWHIQTPSYDIYTTVKYDVVLDRLPNFYETALLHYTTAFGPLPKPHQRFESFLFQDRRQWAAKTRQMLPDQSDLFLRLGRGGFTTRGIAILYYIDYGRWPRDTFAITSHEGWHQYTQQTFKHQLPIWLEEGIATYMEGYRIDRSGVPTFQPHNNRERQRTLRDAIRRDRMIPLSELLRRTPQSFLEHSKDHLLVYYAQVWGLVHFLSEGEDGRYLDGLHQLLADAADGRYVGRLLDAQGRNRTTSRRNLPGKVGAEPLLVYFNSDMSEFERQYLDFVTTLAGVDQPRSSGADARSAAQSSPAAADAAAVE